MNMAPGVEGRKKWEAYRTGGKVHKAQLAVLGADSRQQVVARRQLANVGDNKGVHREMKNWLRGRGCSTAA